MTPELDDALVRDFPKLYRMRHPKRHRGPREPIEFGFEVGDGWEPLIRRLSVKLDPVAASSGVHAVQVKEKNGGLRFYIDGVTKAPAETVTAMRAPIEAAQKESLRTCEQCGAPGKMHVRQGWARTRCDACWNEFHRAGKREEATIAEAPQRRRVRVTRSPQEAK